MAGGAHAAVAAPDAGTSTVDRVLVWLLRAMIVVSGVLVLMSLVSDLRGDWSNWKQGDWLINSIEGPIRRGPSGSALIHLSDALGVSPITAVVGVQAVLAVVLYAAYLRGISALADVRVAVLLTASPAMFQLIWVANIHNGAVRKELIGMAALALLVVYLRDRWVGTIVVAGALLAAGVWSHEVVGLFVPAFLYLAWLASRLGHRRVIAVVCAVVVLSGMAAAWYTLSHMRVDTVAQVCDPLTSRGVADRICQGAIDWVTADSERAQKSLRYRDLNPQGLRNAAGMLALSIAPLLYLTALLRDRRIALYGVLAAVPFLPLFAIVSDWGRWMSCGVFAFVAVLLAHGVSGGLDVRRRPAVWALAGLVVVGLLLVPYHINGIVVGGVVEPSIGILRDFVRAF